MNKVIDWDGSRIKALNYIVNGQLKFEFEGVKFCIRDTCLVFAEDKVFADNKAAYVTLMRAVSYCPNFKEIAKLGVNDVVNVLTSGVEAMQCESYTVMATDGAPQAGVSQGGGQKTKILWVSRHNPLPCQWEFLRQRLGEIEIVQIVQHVPNADFVIELARQHETKYILPVLPLSFIAKLTELAQQHGIIVLWSKMKTLATTSREEAEKLVAEWPDCRTAVCNDNDQCRVFEFETIEKIKAVRLETEPL